MDVPQELFSLERISALLSAPETNNINCHKAVLYLSGLISREELVSDPRSKQEGDFTFRERALDMSDKSFVPIKNANELRALAENECEMGLIYVGQILDAETRELAHSYIVFRNEEGRLMGFDKAGFKEPFSMYEIATLLDHGNYQGQEWRFFPLSEAK